MLKVIILCAQDELDSLGWCVCTESKKKSNVYTEQTHTAENHLKLWSDIYDFPLHISRHAQTNVIYSHNIDIITPLNHK